MPSYFMHYLINFIFFMLVSCFNPGVIQASLRTRPSKAINKISFKLLYFCQLGLWSHHIILVLNYVFCYQLEWPNAITLNHLSMRSSPNLETSDSLIYYLITWRYYLFWTQHKANIRNTEWYDKSALLLLWMNVPIL